jgi:hypothetical protein
MMRGSRTLSTLVLVVALAAISTDPEAAFAQKRKPSPPREGVKAPAVAGFLAADAKLTAEQLARHIDMALEKNLKAEKATISPRCEDHEFLRRAYLDLTGKIPTAAQAQAFLDSKEPGKRAKLIDELLESKEYGRHMADIWQALMLPRNSDNRRFMQYYSFLVKWLEEQFNANTPWDKMTREILTATGDIDKNGAGVFYLANPTADKMTDNVTRMFLGVQLQCAQCHNHPFTDYKQDEYWGMAAFFLHVRPNGNPKAAAKNKDAKIGIVETVTPKGKGKKAGLPESAKILPPKFLSAEQPKVKGTDPVRPLLADWLTTPQNPFFARAMANRIWAQLMGRGLVNPVDDMHDANPASHPELLVDLSKQLAANGFDLKYLFRAICNSEAYQRSTRPAGNNKDLGPELYARQQIKVLSPEQLYDSLTMVVGAPGKGAAPKNKQAAAKGGQNQRETFVSFFSAEDGADPTEYQTGIPQVLQLMNSPRLNSSAVLNTILPSAKTNEEAVEKLYLTTLARRPTKEEQERIAAFLAKTKDSRREAFAGVLWALLNSSEFALNR